MDLKEVKMGRPVKNESEQRLQLVSLLYEVLRDMKTQDDTTDAEMLSLLSRAFFDKGTAMAKLEAVAPKERVDKPTFMYSTLDQVGTSFLRRVREIDQQLGEPTVHRVS
jgi:hypothetical protein